MRNIHGFPKISEADLRNPEEDPMIRGEHLRIHVGYPRSPKESPRIPKEDP